MAAKIVPFRRWHLEWLQGDAITGFKINPSELDVLEAANSWTAVVDGNQVACGGYLQQWPGRNIAWAFLNPKSAPYMLTITRTAKTLMQSLKGRIEMTTRADFEAGHRWAELLGFRIECPILEGYGPEGEAHTAYVRIQ